MQIDGSTHAGYAHSCLCTSMHMAPELIASALALTIRVWAQSELLWHYYHVAMHAKQHMHSMCCRTPAAFASSYTLTQPDHESLVCRCCTGTES